LFLALAKFALDTIVVRTLTGRVWSPLGYIVPSLTLRAETSWATPGDLLVILPILALPFLWIGLSMSVRRAADTGHSPWLGTLFLVPLVNYVVIGILCLVPSGSGVAWGVPSTPQGPAVAPPGNAPRVRPAAAALLAALLASIAIGLGMLIVSVYGLGTYGWGLFFATPFAMGASSAAVYNHARPQPLGATLAVALGGVVLTGCSITLFALEGLVCVAMTAPIAIVIATFGALVGRAVVLAGGRGRGATSLVLVVPALSLGEANLESPTPRDVTTWIDIDAPPEKVWPNVIGFAKLEEPPTWFFRLGIAYPIRARILGEGVGAVRHCEFSTGPFVEPITVWEPPARLAFDVTSQPPSMTEWSPYGAIRAPHLEGYMVSKGGEFDLVHLPGARTRLIGTTHYTLAVYPEIYWTPFAQALVHGIHWRVLRHIKQLSEAQPAGRKPGSL
jgi:hypothetical protein